ncbi:MAG: AarF/ABC1/UbiB kinase family protein [Pseudomonadota bacterium]
MRNRSYKPRGVAVPQSRLSRLARFGGMATGVAGGMALQGAQQLASGKRPSMSDLLLTPANARRVTNQLAQMRGAAMKVGQLMSMEAGDFLPSELGDILSRLRADADYMPSRQLKQVLIENWGADFLKRFERFDTEPLAAASIGQVHRALTRDGRDLAIKVQYPGVRRSIDSDVDNVASLIRLSGLLPTELDISPLLSEAKRQLHEEADYAREGRYLARFGALLRDDPNFRVPELHADLTTETLLAMSFTPGKAIETLQSAPQKTRDHVVTLLVQLMLRELFEFRLMQTDPNFANYRFDEASDRVVLLDFGAAREIPQHISNQYRELLRIGMSGDTEALRAAAIDIGFFAADTKPRHQAQVMAMFEMAMEPLRQEGPFDFATTDVTARLRDAGLEMSRERDFWHIPPPDTLFIQRKIGGIFLLAARLRARLDMRPMLQRYL